MTTPAPRRAPHPVLIGMAIVVTAAVALAGLYGASRLFAAFTPIATVLVYEVDLEPVLQAELETAIGRARAIVREEGCDDPGGPRPGLLCATLVAAAVLDDHATMRVADPGLHQAVLDRLRAELPRSNQVSGPLAADPGPSPLYDVTEGEPGEIRVTVTDAAFEELRRRLVDESARIMRRRLQELGPRRFIVMRAGPDRIEVQVSDERDLERLTAMIGRTAQLTFHLVASDDPSEIARAREGGRLEPNQLLLPTDDPAEPYLIVEVRLRPSDTARDPALNPPRSVRTLSGAYLLRASQGFSNIRGPRDGEPVVNFTFNNTGALIFGKLTTNHVNERIAVALDGRIITAPRIVTPITGGSGYIEGDFTVESASDLAAQLRAGALPAPLRLIEQRAYEPPRPVDTDGETG